MEFNNESSDAQNRNRIARRELSLIFLIIISFLFLVISIRDLLIGPFPDRIWIVIDYVSLFLSVLVLSHSCCILIYKFGKRTLPRTFPKYLDYIYLTFIALSLPGVAIHVPTFLKYIEYTAGTEDEIARKIFVRAKHHLEHDCGDNHRFTTEYCAKLQNVYNNRWSIEFIKNHVISDNKFLDHVVGILQTKKGTRNLYSPIRRLSNDLNVSIMLKSTVDMGRGFGFILWISIVFIPIGLALRILKTTLEIYF